MSRRSTSVLAIIVAAVALTCAWVVFRRLSDGPKPPEMSTRQAFPSDTDRLRSLGVSLPPGAEVLDVDLGTAARPPKGRAPAKLERGRATLAIGESVEVVTAYYRSRYTDASVEETATDDGEKTVRLFVERDEKERGQGEIHVTIRSPYAYMDRDAVEKEAQRLLAEAAELRKARKEVRESFGDGAQDDKGLAAIDADYEKTIRQLEAKAKAYQRGATVVEILAEKMTPK